MVEDASAGGREPRVSYGLKELLQEIRDSVRAVDLKLDTKADVTEVSDINGRLVEVAVAVVNVQSEVRVLKSLRTNTAEFRCWLVPVAVTIIIAAPQWLNAVGIS